MTAAQTRDLDDAWEARRAEILNAAAAVFAEKGYPRATMKEIAARAGVVAGTIYLYFESKRDLLVAIADQLITRPVDQTLARADEMDTESFLAGLIQERMQFARDNRDLLRALVTEIWTDAELQKRFFSQIIAPVLGAGIHYLEERIADRTLRDCRMEIVVPAIAGSIVILSAFRALVPEYILAGVTDADIIDELTALYLRGLLPTGKES